MRIVVTGASGFVGRQLVPTLAQGGAMLLLAGRDPEALQRRFPDHVVCGYDDLAVAAADFDVLLHLAVLNNDADASEAEFMAVNVDFALEVLEKARRANIGTFVNVSSTHALEPGRTDFYSVSKRLADERLRQERGIAVLTLFFPLLYGDAWGGRLERLNRLPRPLARLLFLGLGALKPTAHVRLIAACLGRLPSAGEDRLLVSDGQAGNPVFRIAKRTIDITFALVVLLGFWWMLLIILAIVRLQSHGPGLFPQKRIGLRGATFTCLKFRTMMVGTAEVGTHDAPQTAITAAGRFLRRTKLDELPQAVNILRNQVSLIGPRPCLPVQVELIAARRRRGVLDLLPGITGFAQVNGVDMSDPERLARYDSHYLAMQSLLLDLRIALATLRGGRRAASDDVVPGSTGATLAAATVNGPR